MESPGHNKKDTSTQPKFTMRTRRQIAEEKRKAEEEIQMVKEAKKRKEMYEPRENEDVKPQDIVVDPKLLKIYIGHVENETDVKEEIVLEDSEGEEVHLEGLSGGIQVFQQDEVIELVAENQQQNVQAEEIGVQTEEIGVQTEEIGVQTEDKGVQTEEKGVQVEVKGVQVEENGVQTEGRSVLVKEKGVLVEGKIVEDQNETDWEPLPLDKVLPNVLPLLNQKDVFRCRLVNKEWRQMVDEFLEDSLVPQHYDDEAYLKKVKSCPSQLCPLPKFRNVKYAYQFKSERSLDMFNEHMTTHMDSGLSPFVGGATVALVNLFPASCRLSRATKQFLEKFGVYIRRMIIRQGGLYLESYVDFDIIGFVDCVKKCLHHVPNLERLKIVGNCLNRDEKGRIPDLQLKILRNEPLDRTPKLDKLDTLEFQYWNFKGSTACRRCAPDSCVPYLEEIFGDLMIKPYYQSQLKNLSLDWPNDWSKYKLCNVTELSLLNFQSYEMNMNL